ncbi:protein tyrosine kinase [Heterostelium album PN500]|uniref:non-specific serine/threonine protein kinase n=1 Tax=Heterostelium pallidum (strain ATCC 26659 / Pp 5 / PN500) TaxID=670386 RepID=D3B9Q6_HETP5|nr:protein tyrosine kinase [Heterostelium album PN500]EFA81968.1 protein tyrosine kinase [Heterostelium album PN500]|eukprot:XP_020434085.1 protein tyrosine kinase [Heterostelium album PN500]
MEPMFEYQKDDLDENYTSFFKKYQIENSLYYFSFVSDKEFSGGVIYPVCDTCTIGVNVSSYACSPGTSVRVGFVFIKKKIGRMGYKRIRDGKNIDIGEVSLGERIGKGNFGEVFKGHWRGAVVAIKKLPAHNITDHVLKEFHREIELMRNLRHPNVIQFLGSCTIPPNICICTEYMPRGSLYSILHDPKISLSWALIRNMCLDAVRGIIYLHNSNPVILHRDLKSHNLLVDDNWKVKVADFGLSTIEQTATMTACGTPCWTAPEVLRNQRYTEKADVYSFGIVMWECATRADPYHGMPPFQVIFAVGREGLRPPVPKGPKDFITLISDCWAENPEKRPSMEKILVRLEMMDLQWPDVQFKGNKNVN